MIWLLFIGILTGLFVGTMMKSDEISRIGDLIAGVVGSLLGGNVSAVLGISAYGAAQELLVSIFAAVGFVFLVRLSIKLPYNNQSDTIWEDGDADATGYEGKSGI